MRTMFLFVCVLFLTVGNWEVAYSKPATAQDFYGPNGNFTFGPKNRRRPHIHIVPQVRPNGHGGAIMSTPNGPINVRPNDVNQMMNEAIQATQKLIEEQRKANTIDQMAAGLAVELISSRRKTALQYGYPDKLYNMNAVTQCIRNVLWRNSYLYNSLHRAPTKNDAVVISFSHISHCAQ